MQLGLGGEAVGLSSRPYTQPIQLQAELSCKSFFSKKTYYSFQNGIIYSFLSDVHIRLQTSSIPH